MMSLLPPMPSRSSASPPAQGPASPPRNASPVVPLAPLEYLQNHRRGSITDPSLHAATSSSSLRQIVPAHFLRDTPDSYNTDPRPSSTYTFGDASLHRMPDNGSAIRKGLRSPSFEHDSSRSMSGDSTGAFAICLLRQVRSSPI
jgi:hypothetical protein